MSDFHSTHNLPFEMGGPYKRDGSWQHYKVGTCYGLWKRKNKTYEILSILNDVPGNGHLQDLLEWFEHHCRRDKKALRIKEFFLNPGFKQHLINKRGFVADGKDDVIKKFI